MGPRKQSRGKNIHYLTRKTEAAAPSLLVVMEKADRLYIGTNFSIRHFKFASIDNEERPVIPVNNASGEVSMLNTPIHQC